MDQAASANQGLLWHQRERGEGANLDRGVGLRAGGNRAQAVGAGSQSLPDSTDSPCYSFRENAHFTGTSRIRLLSRLTRSRQPIDSVRLLTGQQ
jgi:hypothetical protein